MVAKIYIDSNTQTGLLDALSDDTVGCWTGATDSGTEGTWVWSNGDPWFDLITWTWGMYLWDPVHRCLWVLSNGDAIRGSVA